MKHALACTMLLALGACGGDDGPGAGADGGGPGTLGNLGDPCTLTSDCTPDLYCDASRRCAGSGAGGDGAMCTTTADCMRGYMCVREPDGRFCRLAGDRGIGEPCLRDEQCLAGLRCTRGMCSGDAPDAGPVGFDAGQTGCMTSSECDDGSPCTTDMCIADECVHTLIDGDEDGYAATIIGPCGLDCAEMDPNANPDQEEYFATRHGGGAGQPRTFDWNCDGVEEGRYGPAITCVEADCESGEGWLDGDPGCGNTGRWGRCAGAGLGCTPEVIDGARQQTCR